MEKDTEVKNTVKRVKRAKKVVRTPKPEPRPEEYQPLMRPTEDMPMPPEDDIGTKDILIKVSEEGDDGIRVTIDTKEKDTSAIATNVMLALCAIYKIPEQYLPEVFNALGNIILKVHGDQKGDK